jgi:hypothetical protein
MFMAHRIASGVLFVACLVATGTFAGCQSSHQKCSYWAPWEGNPCATPVVVTIHHGAASDATLPASIVIVEPLVVDNVLPGTVRTLDQRYGEYLSGRTAKCVGQMCGLSVRRSDVQATTLPVGGPVQPINAEMGQAQEDALVTTKPVAPPVCPPGIVRIGGKVEIYVTDVYGSGPIEKWDGTTVAMGATSSATQPASAQCPATTRPAVGARTPTAQPAALADLRPVRRYVRVSASYLIQTGPECPGIVVQVWTPQCEFTNELRKPLKERICDEIRGKEVQVDQDRDMAAIQDTKIRAMLDLCAQQLCLILQPREQSATLALRPTFQPYGARGITRLQAGNYANAVNQLETAVYTEPDDGDLHFDLAVADEAAGYLSAAWQHYREARNLNGRKDMEAETGATRIELLLQREDYLRQLALARAQANVKAAK